MEYTLIVGYILIAVIIVIIVSDYMHQYQQFKLDNIVNDHNDSVATEILELLDQFDQWNDVIETKEGYHDLLVVLNDICVNIFNTKISVNITQDEFNRLSNQQTQQCISQLIDQIRYQLCSQQSDRVIDLQ